MKKAIVLVAVLALGVSGAALANKASAPGQDKVCLTTASDGSGANLSILAAKWLPRKAADKQLSKGVGHAQGDNAKIYEYDEMYEGLTPKETCDGLNPGGALNNPS